MLLTENIIPREGHIADGLIESVTRYEFQGANTWHFVPEGRIELLFQVKGSFSHRQGQEEPWSKRPFSFVGGMHASSYLVRSESDGGECLGLRLRPEMAHRVLGDRLYDFKDSMVELSDVFGKQGADLSEQVLALAQDFERIALVKEFLIQETRRNSPGRYSEALDLTDLGISSKTIPEQAKDLNLSSSQFRKVFKGLVGLPPKLFFKIRRVNQAIDLIQSGVNENLTGISYTLGYFDQSHFIREFRSVTGKSPKAFLRK